MSEIEAVLKKLNDDGWECQENVNIAYTNVNPQVTRAANIDINEARGRLDFINSECPNLLLTLALFAERPIILTLYGPLEGPQTKIFYGSYTMVYTGGGITPSGIMPNEFEKKSHAYSYFEFLNFTIKELLMDLLI